MPLKLTGRSETGITVPYGPIKDRIRNNRGFMDVRGNPERAAQIPEGEGSEALRNLLVRIAVENVYFSLGCDLGMHSEGERLVAGGYIQVAGIKYRKVKTRQYDTFCDLVAESLGKLVASDDWEINFVRMYVQFKLASEPKIKAPSIWIWFFASAATQTEALASRERLINALRESFHQPKTAAVMTPAK